MWLKRVPPSTGDLHIITQKRQPILGLLRASSWLHPILANRLWARRLQAKYHEFPMDPFGTPQDILPTQSSDQRPHLLADLGASRFASTLPASPWAKGLTLPLENCLWLHQLDRRFPSIPDCRQPDPQEAKSWRETRSTLVLLLDAFFVERKLTAQANQLTAQ